MAQFRALAKFRHALRAFLAFSESGTAASGVTPMQYQSLLVIKVGEGEVSVSDLARELLIQHNGTVQLVDRLVAANLVRRKPSATDRRVAVLALTSKGEAKLKVIASAHLAKLANGRAEWTSVAQLVGKMRDNGRNGAGLGSRRPNHREGYSS
jgi:DNA-binding MarR family transcriptional regulator